MKKVVGDVTGCKLAKALSILYGVKKRGKYRAIILMSEPDSTLRFGHRRERTRKIELVDANHNVFPGQSKTVTFTIPKGASLAHHSH